MDEYVPRRPRCLGRLQQTPFPYTEAIYRTILAEIFPSGLRRPCVHDFTGWSARHCGLPRTDPTASLTPLQSLVPVTLVRETDPSDRAHASLGPQDQKGSSRCSRDLKNARTTFAQRARVIATATLCSQAHRSASPRSDTRFGRRHGPDRKPMRRTSSFTHSRKFVCKILEREPSELRPDLVRCNSAGSSPAREENYCDGAALPEIHVPGERIYVLRAEPALVPSCA
jgi:hypothetical protein